MDTELLAAQRISRILSKLELDQQDNVLQFVARRVSHDRDRAAREEKLAYEAQYRRTAAVESVQNLALPMMLAGDGPRS